MRTVDLVIVLAYLLLLFAWAIRIGLRETAEDFLIFSRRAPLLLVMFSVISTWVGVGTTVATAASGFQTGISLGLTAALGGMAGAFSAAWFAPRLKRFGDHYGAHTIGDFFGVRYSHGSRLASSLLILFVYTVLTAAQFVGMGALVQVWSGQAFKYVVVFAAVSTVIYTAFAGIKSDFYTDVVHFILMTAVLFFVLLPLTFRHAQPAGGFSSLPSSFFDPFAFGGVAFFVGGLVFGAGSVFVMMELWQRVYASSSASSARTALFWSILVIILFYGVATMLGMLARLLFPDLADPDQALFKLMVGYLPPGVLGLGAAAFLAIFISTINSTIMVCSATLTKDIYWALSRTKRQTSLLLAGRAATFICGAAALGIALAVPDIVVLSVNGMFLLLVLLPAIAGGFFSRRITSVAALLSIIMGAAVTLGFYFVDASTAFVPGFLASGVILILVSALTKHRDGEDLRVVEIWRGER